MPFNPQCDFCHSEAVQWSYPAESFRIRMPDPLPDWGSDGPWAACTCCHDLIEAGKVAELIARSVETCGGLEMVKVMTGIDLHPYIVQLHSEFHKRRLGPAIRVGMLN